MVIENKAGSKTSKERRTDGNLRGRGKRTKNQVEGSLAPLLAKLRLKLPNRDNRPFIDPNECKLPIYDADPDAPDV